MSGWMDKQNVVNTYSGILALKRKEILLYATIWMNFEDTMLNETSQPQKDKYCMSPLTGGTKLVKFTATESRMVGIRGQGKRKRKVVQWIQYQICKIHKL